MPRIFGYQITSADILKGPLTLLDNQSSPVNLITYSLTGIRYVQIQYGLVRNSQNLTGHILITTDGSSVSSIADSNAETQDLGISFSASVSGSNLYVSYTTTSTGFDATMTYYDKSWQ
jgi:hypothetical protein